MRVSRIVKTALVLVLALAMTPPSGSLAQAQVAVDEKGSRPEQREEQRLRELAMNFFEWRRAQQPVTGDDISRVERPTGWLPDWSPAALESYRSAYREFLEAAESLDMEGAGVPQRVDARLLESAIQRVYWELEVLQSPRRNPLFYLQQTLGSVFELLVLSSPVDAARADAIVRRLEHIPATLKFAQTNLDRPIRPFARAAIDSLQDIEMRLQDMRRGLEPHLPEEKKPQLENAVRRAVGALESYRKWLEGRLGTMQTSFAIGPRAYQWFLVNVALLPHTPDELLMQGRQAWNRSVAWDLLERQRNRDVPAAPLLPTAERQAQVAFVNEQEIRAFLQSRELMSVPDGLQPYRFRPMPAYLAPLAFMGVTNDLGSESRLGEGAWRYVPEPRADLPYFQLSAARDPRPLIIHEGVPGHYFQLAQSWASPNPLRRRYIDSSVNEGIAFYVEELLLQAGLFDFSPAAREIIYSYMRLRALRVEADIRLAVGDFSIEQAADYLAQTVPMDRETALAEAVFFAFNPGQAISYQVGKLQILRFLADARLDRGEDFSLENFHDFLMRNGNVPIALQRWEYLGRDDDVMRLDALGARPVTVPR